jgi:DNA primase
VKERGRGAAAGPTLSDAVLIGTLLLHPEIAAERLEELSHVTFAGRGVAALAHALALSLAEEPGIDADALRARLEAEHHGQAIAAVLQKLARDGYGSLPEAESERAAALWDDAAHLRLRAGALSIERQAAAMALGRETSDFHLSRLRDIQEQDQRSLRPDSRDETGDAVIVHPFKPR